MVLLAGLNTCLADPPKNYYYTATDKTGRAFRSALHDIIDDHRVIRYSSKNPDTADALAKLDADPGNPNSVILIYSRRSELISNFGTTSGWNREHLWCNSYGIDKRGPAYSDLHNLRPADASVNSARSNKIFDTSDTRDAKYQKPGHPEAELTSEDSDSWEPPADVRGDVRLQLSSYGSEYRCFLNSKSNECLKGIFMNKNALTCELEQWIKN